ncbi:hypothetical protein BCR37DRAFT_391233 [Protomyces lactucae-debilis]|uniref:C2H2-type domain-containing protein n=1 Tax=Protomyces lactucae-debilis TaxID=2754530 RepID=A0A1Y2FN93_PROLT|nr:uncharacterized protein BCR37DRAFT_391233 [Protomyces lactucae-debilis]ORY85452.1 hypothetical protein BCR37DRAFT_391233 [Protomyces lactucae-debilis]
MPPSSSEATVKDAPSTSAHTKSARIQTQYPQLFDNDGRKPDTSDSPVVSPNVDFRSNNYFMGMESSVRFEGKTPRGGQGGRAPVVADRMKKLNAVPNNVPTVSPVEAFLEMPSMPAPSMKHGSSNETSLPTASRESSAKSDSIFAPPRASTQDPRAASSSTTPSAGHSEPSSIIPVRQNGHQAPRPVQNQYGAYSQYGGPMDVRSYQPAKQADHYDAAYHGPSAVQALQNKDANARFRTLNKEDSSISNMSSMSSGYGDSESEPSASQQYALQQHQQLLQQQQLPQHTPASTMFACDECGRNFEKQTSLTAHKRVHNKATASASRSPTGVAGDVDDGDDFVPPPDADDERSGSSSAQFSKNGPHRCDWIIPSTGQRCGTVFSRPYDLVRHQDTIHGKKRKEFRCEICKSAAVEKVFSRNDALVRHMRHVHNRELKK